MPGLLEHDLDAYSRVVVLILLERFPDWEPLGVVRPHPDGSGASVEFTIPCPSAAAETGLWISTAEDELTVGFDTHHRHFTNYEDRTNPGTIAAGLDYVADILAERTGICNWYRAGQLGMTTSIELPGEKSAGDTIQSADDFFGRLTAGCDRVTIRSWTGKFDRTEVIG